MTGPPLYSFTQDDLQLVDRVHDVITANPDRFRQTGAALDRRFSVAALLEADELPVGEEQRQAIIQRALSGEEPDSKDVARLARSINDWDAAREIVLRSRVEAVLPISESDWESRGKRLGQARLDLLAHYLPVETPSPDWEWSAHVLLVFWLIVEPRAEAAAFLTDFQRWRWDSFEAEDLYPDEAQVREMPRSAAPFGIVDWPTLLNGVRRAMRCAERLDLMSKAIAAEAEEIQLPFLRPEEYAAHGLLLEQSPLVPIPSPKISSTLAKMRFFLSDEVFRRHTAPKLRILGLQAHPKYGYFYPLGARARRMGPSNPSTSKSHG